MKNTPAAIDAYRRAVDINPCDYRAWYGLGQANEMMGMPLYAPHYFRKSIFFLPNDSRLWIAMAKCYQTEQLYMLEEPIKCYEKAAKCTDTEGITLNQLAKLERNKEAAFYFKKDLERLWFFLLHISKTQEKFEEAEVYCTGLLDYSGPISFLLLFPPLLILSLQGSQYPDIHTTPSVTKFAFMFSGEREGQELAQSDHVKFGEAL